MIHIKDMQVSDQSLIVLISPPASGKTFWVNSFRNRLSGDTSVLLISPLRALADECKLKWKTSITVMTPEEWLINKSSYDVVIVDEFHLFFYWGDTFRPIMWEMFFELSQTSKLMVLLTATLSDEMRDEIKKYSTQFDCIWWLNYGNRTLINLPERYLKISSKKMILKLIENQSKNQGVKLIFCEFRQEVLDLEKNLQKLGFNCISCIGGESRLMAEKFKKNPTPDFIIATKVLSHGVNLPQITKIFFTYRVKNIDFWIQMVARGGRRGDSYSVYSLECPVGIKWSRTKNFFQVKWEYLKLSLFSSSSSFLFPKS